MIPRLIDKADRLEFPAILKNNNDEHGVNSLILDPRIDAAETQQPGLFLASIRLRPRGARHPPAAARGRIVHAYTVTFDMGDRPFVKGNWCEHRAMKAVDDETFLDVFADILQIAGFTDGTCCVDCKVVDGIPKILEVNPRFGWSLLYDVLGNHLRAYAIAARA